MKNLRLLAIFAVVLLASFMFSLNAFAQSGGPVPDPQAVPIDGGVSLLAAAGIAYGAKKLHERRKK
jgi:hypothetical protein